MAFNMCLYVPWKTIILIILWKEVYTLPNTVVDDVPEKDFSSCEEGWKPYDQYCFKLFTRIKNWMDASNDCKRMGGHLASIHSKEQNDFIEKFFAGGFGLFWIGLRDHDLDDIFVWHDETNVTFTYWNPGEPHGKYTSGDCVELYLQGSSLFQFGKWLVYKCDHTLPYLCQKKFATSAFTSSNNITETIATSAITISNINSEATATSVITSSNTVSATTTSLTSRNNLDHTNVYMLPNTVADDVSVKDFSSCEEGWKPYDQYCFKLVESDLNWTDASNECKSMGGHLASINSKEENDFLETFYYGDRLLFWIGLHDHDLDGIFVWDDKTDLTYTNWNPGEPHGQYTSGDCVVLNLGKSSLIFEFKKWLVYKCEYKLHYLCKKKIATSSIARILINSENTTSLSARTDMAGTKGFISVTALVITLLTVIVFMALIIGIVYHKRHWLEETHMKIFYRKAEGPTSTEPYTKLVLEPKLANV